MNMITMRNSYTVFILFFFIDANVVKEPLVGIREDCTRTAMGSEHEGSM
jgi:hypothetical protein